MPHVTDAFGFPLEHTAPNVDQMNAASTAALNPPQQTMGASSTDMSQVNGKLALRLRTELVRLMKPKKLRGCVQQKS